MAASSKKLWPEGSSLPLEVVEEEILGRIPIEDVMRAKSVCKEWYAVSKDKRFIYKHLDLSQDDARFIRIHDTTFQIINPVTLDLLTLPFPSELISTTCNRLSCVIHCDGLLLCAFRDANKERRKLAVWNPVFSSRIKWIEPPLHGYSAADRYGFGYDSDHKYKILRFGVRASEYQIYDFKSKLWRVFPATSDWIMLFQYVSMKGNMYWLAETRRSDSQMLSDSQMFIQSFDFSKEIFKPICSSFPVKIGVDLVRHEALDIVVLSGFGGDRLSLLHQHRVGDDIPRIEVWVTNKLTDAAVSWTKYFNVTHPHLPILHPLLIFRGIPTYFIHKTNGIMLWCDRLVQEDKDVQIEDYDYACPTFYEISEGEIRNQVETGPLYAGLCSPCLCGGLYVPSLVPVPE